MKLAPTREMPLVSHAFPPLPRFQVDAPDLVPGAVRAARHTRAMATATTVVIPRSGPAIREALGEHAPGFLSQFEAEMRTALTQASKDCDLSIAEAVLVRWQALATMAANPLTPAEEQQLARARAGDLRGLRARDEHGGWVTL
jgi:Family of unknown function (DUF6247)